MNFTPALILVASLAAPQPVAPRLDRSADLFGSPSGVTRTVARTTPLPRAALYIPQPAKHSKARSIAGLVIGGAVGFYAGGAIGYATEHKLTEGRCYDVCFRGFMIGAPVGAIAGAILGWKLF